MSLPGKVVTVARHLGSQLGEKASFTHELPRRRQATMAAFYSVGQLWYESRVSWRLKRSSTTSRAANTALSGIEAFCPSKAQHQALTSLVTCLARRVMAGAAARRGEHGRVRSLTNKEVLHSCALDREEKHGEHFFNHSLFTLSSITHFFLLFSLSHSSFFITHICPFFQSRAPFFSITHSRFFQSLTLLFFQSLTSLI